MKWDREEIASFIGTIGVAMLVASGVRYSIQGELLTTSKVLLIAGGVFVLAAVVFGFRAIVRAFSGRTAQQGTNTTILTLAVIAILAVINFVGLRHHKTFDLTTEKLYTLSDQTRNIVSGLKQDLTVARFDKTPNNAFDDLMAEYKALSPHFKYQFVDPQQKPEVAQDFGATHMGDVVIAYGVRKDHLDAGVRGQLGEEDVTGAIVKVTSDKVKEVCFVTGHGEKSLTDSSQDGYTQVDAGLKKENYATKTINLIAENGVPADCSVVVIAGPKQSFYPQESAMLGKFLDAGGEALIMVDPATDPKLDDLFHAWNVDVGSNVVVDASGMGQLFGGGPIIPVVQDFGSSPITKGFQGSVAFFPLARTASIADKSKSIPQTVELLKTSERSFTIPKLEPGQKKISFDSKTDKIGPLSLGVAANRKVGDKDARLVVIGNSQFAANPWVSQQRNGDLFFNTIDWLTQDENLISIRPKSATNRRVTLSEAQSAALHWLNLVFLPGLVIFSGVYIWWKRR
ncbi:MAG TPA: GldG family protein [Candidatus Acidoferrales bacterium]